MPQALWTGATGMAAQQTNVDLISNNIANVNTIGFKRQVANFQDLFYDTQASPGTQAGDLGRNPTGIQIGNGVRLSSTPRIFTTGTITPTGVSTDMAIQGEGFFQVTLPDGTFAYTKAGDFRPDADGKMVTPDGYYLTPNITLPQDATNVSISTTGQVTALLPGNSTPQVLGNIQLSRFLNESGLTGMGQNLFQETVASGPAQQGLPGSIGFGTITGGALENSNVEVVTELVNMIVAQRAYEMNSKSIQTADQMLQTANDIVR
jgi:flagellar basal-body rod protein FlgG